MSKQKFNMELDRAIYEPLFIHKAKTGKTAKSFTEEAIKEKMAREGIKYAKST